MEQHRVSITDLGPVGLQNARQSGLHHGEDGVLIIGFDLTIKYMNIICHLTTNYEK
jgi:hypothetical protein